MAGNQLIKNNIMTKFQSGLAYVFILGIILIIAAISIFLGIGKDSESLLVPLGEALIGVGTASVCISSVFMAVFPLKQKK